MQGANGGRPWASPIDSAIIKPRHKFGIDGRLLFMPIILPCGVAILFSHGWWQFWNAVICVAFWLAARVLWEWDPWFIDDYQTECALPHSLTDVAYEARRRPSAMGRRLRWLR